MNFSVVIPCYNAGFRISDTLDSIGRQTHQPFEVIVVDDGSTDDSVDRVAKHSVPTHHLKSNRGGPAGARNVGMRAATGDVIAFLDADDLWHEDHLEMACKMLADDSTVACASDMQLLDEPSGKVFSREIAYPMNGLRTDLTHDDFVDCFLKTGVFWQPSVVVRRSAVGDGLDESLWGTEDIEFFMRVVYGKRWAFNPEATVIYRQSTPGSVSGHTVRQTQQLVAALEKATSIGYDSPNMREILARSSRRAIVASLTYGDRQERQAAWEQCAKYLSESDSRRMRIARVFRVPFQFLNQRRRKKRSQQAQQDLDSRSGLS